MHNFLFGIYPYIALSVLIIGSIARYERDPFTWKTSSSQLQHLDGYEMTKFMAWAQGIFTFQSDAASHIVDVAWIFKLHLFLGLTIFLVFPFTRLVHMFSVPVRYFMRPGYQIVRSRRTRPLSDRNGRSVH